MKKALLIVGVLFLGLASVTAQHRSERVTLLSGNPFGPLYGLYAVTIERIVEPDLGVVVAPIYYNVRYSAYRSLLADGTRAWHAGALAGINSYPGGRAPRGFFWGAFFRAGYMELEDVNGDAGGVFIAPSAAAGFRILVGRLAITPRLRIGYALPLFDHDSIERIENILFAPTDLQADFGIGLAIVL